MHIKKGVWRLLSGFTMIVNCVEAKEQTEALYGLKGNEKVLEIACGEGESALDIAKVVRRGSVVAVDFSMSVIEKAKKKHLQSPSHLSFKYKPWDSLSFEDRFDLVRLVQPKGFALNQADFLKKVHGLLKSEGLVAIEIAMRLPVALQSVIKASITSEKWTDRFMTFHHSWPSYEKEEYKKILEKMEYKAITMKTASGEEVFSSLEDFQEFLLVLLPHFNQIEEEEKKLFLEDLTQRYLKIFPLDKEGRVHMMVEKLEVLAQKV